MPKKKTQEREKIEWKYIRLETAMLMALVTFVVGFFTGEIIEFTKSDRPTTGMQQWQMGQQPPQVPAQRPSLTPEQKRNKILELEKKVASNSSDGQAWNELGHLYLDTHQPEQGIQAFKKVLELNPKNAHAWTDLGIMYRQNKQPVEAVKAFDKAIEIEPRSSGESRYLKGVTLMQDFNDPEGGIEAWEEWLEVNPSDKLPNGQSLRDAIEGVKKKWKERKREE